MSLFRTTYLWRKSLVSGCQNACAIQLQNIRSMSNETKASNPIWSHFLPKRLNDRIEKKNKPAVAVLNLHGIIMAQMGGGFPPSGRKVINLGNLRTLIDTAFSTKKLEAVLLNINSPGGSPVQCELISEYIWSKSKDKSVPVYTFVEDMAASGGYWLACIGQKIFVSPSSVVGSIGVISASFGLNEAISKLGIERRVLTAGKNKSLFDPFRPVEEKDTLILQNILNQLHQNFKDHVIKSRGDRLGPAREQLFTGEIWVGQQSIDLGLADGVHNVDSFIRSEFGGENRVRTVYIKSPGSKLQEYLGNASAMTSASSLTDSTALQRQQLIETALLYNFDNFSAK